MCWSLLQLQSRGALAARATQDTGHTTRAPTPTRRTPTPPLLWQPTQRGILRCAVGMFNTRLPPQTARLDDVAKKLQFCPMFAHDAICWKPRAGAWQRARKTEEVRGHVVVCCCGLQGRRSCCKKTVGPCLNSQPAAPSQARSGHAPARAPIPCPPQPRQNLCQVPGTLHKQQQMLRALSCDSARRHTHVPVCQQHLPRPHKRLPSQQVLLLSMPAAGAQGGALAGSTASD
jgi:hypothetical protein